MKSPLLKEGLQVLVHADSAVCRSLFSVLFEACWANCPNDGDRGRISTAIETLLARPYHTQSLQDPRRTNSPASVNSVKDLLSVLPNLDPVPYIDPSLLVYLAENYNSWHEVINHLEKQYVGLKNEERGQTILAAIRHCYKKLKETDIWMNLAVESCRFPPTERAITLDLYGYLDEALEAYDRVVSEFEAYTAKPEPSDYEMDLWEERWVHINRERCQLAVVSDFADSSSNHRLQLECAWKRQEWSKLRSLCTSTSLLPAVESGDAEVKISETLLSLADGKLNDVENLHAQAAQLCLYNWQLLPSVSSGSPCHATLLHFFHRLVEVRESGQIMAETASHSSGRTLPDFKNLLGAWRHRLPNDWEPISQWNEIFAWRAQMFRTITKSFQWAGPGVLSALHDAPWSSARMAKTARKHGSRELSLLLLNQEKEREVNVADAYLKLREQILTYYGNSSELERTGGLNIVNNTNIDYFDASQKSELFRLKASFHQSLGGRSKANQAFCHALLISPENSKAWVSWGELCASLGAVTEEQIEKTGSTESDNEKEAMTLAMKKVPQYLTQAMACFLEAIRIDPNEWSRLYLPKCLWMLSKDSLNAPVICPRFESRGLMLPPWVWYVIKSICVVLCLPTNLIESFRFQAPLVSAALDGFLSSGGAKYQAYL
jgi:transformation/transcription domain-associated protein